MAKLRGYILCFNTLIAACLSVELNFTSDKDVYKMFPVTFMNFEFEVKAKDNVNILLAPSDNPASSIFVAIALMNSNIKVNGSTDTEYSISNLLSAEEFRKFRVFWVPERFVVMERYFESKWNQLFTYSDFPPSLTVTHIGFKAPPVSEAKWSVDTTVSSTEGFSISMWAPPRGSIRFQVQSATEVNIDFFGSAKNYGPNFQVIIGANGNTKSSIIYSPGAGAKKIREHAVTNKILHEEEFKVFWLKWSPTLTRSLTLGTDENKILITLSLPNSEFVNVKYLEFGTDDGLADWEIIPEVKQSELNSTNDQCEVNIREIIKSADSIRKIQESSTCAKLDSKPLNVDDKINVAQVHKLLQNLLAVQSETPGKTTQSPVGMATTAKRIATTKDDEDED